MTAKNTAAAVVLMMFVTACARDDAPVPAGNGGDPVAQDGTEVASGPWERARSRGVTFRAIGQEPGWSLEIVRADSLLLDLDYGARHLEFPLPSVESEPGVRRYGLPDEDPPITIVIADSMCADIMSGEAFPASVTLTVDHQVLRGCGRDL